MSENQIRQQIYASSQSSLADDDLFSHLPEDDPFEEKKDRMAAELAALMSYCRKNRTTLAEGLGWKKSQVTRVLSGKQNLTLKTLWEFCSHLGYDFDVIFRRLQELPHNHQPWQRNVVVDAAKQPIEDSPSLSQQIKIQTPTEVIKDCLEGRAYSMYIGINSVPAVSTGILKTVDIPALDVPMSEPNLNFVNFVIRKKDKL